MNNLLLTVGFLLLGPAAMAHSSEHGSNRGGSSNGGGQQQQQERPRPPKMDEATKAKVDACAKEVGMPARDSGTRPSRELHEKFKACLAKQGIELPEPPPHERRGEGKDHQGGQGQGEGAPPPPAEPKK